MLALAVAAALAGAPAAFPTVPRPTATLDRVTEDTPDDADARDDRDRGIDPDRDREARPDEAELGLDLDLDVDLDLDLHRDEAPELLPDPYEDQER